MKHFKFIILFLLLAVSCDTKMAKPDNLISEDIMVEILTDLTLINATQVSNKKLVLSNGILPEKFIYEKYNIDSLQFVASNNYYAHHIKKYERIYDKLKVKLNAKKAEYLIVDAAEKKEKKKRDSLRKVKDKRRKDSLVSSKKPKDTRTEKKPIGLLKTTDSLPE